MYTVPDREIDVVTIKSNCVDMIYPSRKAFGKAKRAEKEIGLLLDCGVPKRGGRWPPERSCNLNRNEKATTTT